MNSIGIQYFLVYFFDQSFRQPRHSKKCDDKDIRQVVVGA